MKTERLLSIWLLLAGNPGGYTIKELADRFGVNIRTIYRDMAVLDTELRVPIYIENKRWKIARGHFLPPISFTLTEALNIFLAARLMLQYSHRYDPNIDSTFTKLGAVLPPTLSEQLRKTMDWMQRMEKNDKHLSIMATVAEGWANQRRLRITYRALDAERATEREIEPYFIEPAAAGHASYLVAYCCLKEEIRTFKIERIEKIELTDKPYTIPKNFDANELFSSSWGITVEGEVQTIKLRIKDRATMRIMEETVWHPSQILEKQDDGSLVMTIQVTDTVDLFSWILSWGEKVEVLEPVDMRENLIKTLEIMRELYTNKLSL